MALSSLSGVRARVVKFRVPVAVCAAAALAVTVIPGGVGQAAPSQHLSLRQVESRVAALNVKAEKITEAYDGARTSLTTLQRKERITNAELAKDRTLLATVERRVAAGASAAYRNGALDPALSLMSSADPEVFLSQTSSLNEVARYQATQEAAADAAQRTVAAAQVVHDAQVKQQRATLASIASKRSQIRGLLSQETTLLSHLKAAQRARLAREHAAAVHHEVAQRTSFTPSPSPTTSSPASTPSYNGAASGRAAVAIQYAYAQLGKPYVWGGAGPDSFDCSGLVMRAWGAAGVGLPHSAAGDQAMLPSVSASDLEPGDLIFYGDPAYHVALYIGGGRIIQAPHTGANVEIASVGSMTSAGRP